MEQKNRQVEMQLRKRKTKMEAQVESWILKFDQDMGERQSEIEAVQEQYDAELSQLEELQKRFDDLESEYNEIMEQRRIEVRGGEAGCCSAALPALVPLDVRPNPTHVPSLSCH